MPLLLPAKHWKTTNRYSTMGSEMFKLKDRKDSDYILAPTFEEEITSIVAQLPPQLNPLKLYQIGQKFRDEIRPRNGLLRAREFQMLDLYTFDHSVEESIAAYDQVSKVFCSIFQDMGVNVLVAEADSGAIGGSKSHEYHVVCEGGEDTVLNCSNCGYTANIEQAKSKISLQQIEHTNDTKWTDIEQLILSRVKEYNIDTSLIEISIPKPNHLLPTAALIIPRGRKINHLHVDKLQATLSNEKGNQIFIDSSLVRHFTSDIKSTDIHIAQIIESQEDDECLNCSSSLKSNKCIEIGHTFHLSDKYSRQLACRTKDKKHYEMGCHGIGTTRLLGAIAELSKDGIIWPEAIVPFKCLIIGVTGFESAIEAIHKKAEILFGTDECVIDDRDVKMKDKLIDAKNVGYSVVLVVGNRFKKDGTFDVIYRGETLSSTLNGLDQLFNK